MKWTRRRFNPNTLRVEQVPLTRQEILRSVALRVFWVGAIGATSVWLFDQVFQSPADRARDREIAFLERQLEDMRSEVETMEAALSSMAMRDDAVYREHFVIVPKYVFKSLSTWYSCNCTIERPVHTFKRNVIKGTRHLDSVRQSQGLRSSRNQPLPYGSNVPHSPSKKHAPNGLFQGQVDQENPETVQGGEASSQKHDRADKQAPLHSAVL